jgi:hypothetical protein
VLCQPKKNKTMNREKIEEELSLFRKAPLSIIISALILSGFIWLFLDQYVYKNRMQDYESRISLLEEQVSIYKEKKFIVGETEFSKLSNNELKKYSENKLKALNATYKQYKMMDTLSRKYDLSWDEMMAVSDKQRAFGSQMILDYIMNHKTEVVLLREQMLMRLPKKYTKASRIDDYNHPTNPIGFRMMLDDFQKLTLNLPNGTD